VTDAAAKRLVSRLIERTRTLATSPGQGRPGRVAGTRELTVGGTQYLILYRLMGDDLELLRVIHTSQDRPPKA
jgi:toxin ParE1/3/4